MNGLCEMYLVATLNRCEEPAVFYVESRRPEVHAEERGEGEFCFAHAVQLAGCFLDDGRPEYRIVLLSERPE